MLISAKENYLRLWQNKDPQYVPAFTMMGTGYRDRLATKTVNPSLFPATHRGPQGGKDLWGVSYIANAETGFASIPEPNNFILEDVTKWDKVVKAPAYPDSVDWEQLARTDIETSGIDRNVTALVGGLGLMPFQQLIALMGFNEGLCALVEEPEAVTELLEYMSDFYMPTIRAMVEHYKPDIVYLLDDTASKYAPFFSVDTYVNIFKPIYLKMTRPAVERGIPVQMHNCGKCEPFVEHMIDFGVRYWDPSQTENDLAGVIERFNGTVNIVGGFDFVPDGKPYDEGHMRAFARNLIDRYAPTMHYAFSGGILAPAGDEKTKEAVSWVQDEIYTYGTGFYDKSLLKEI